MKLKIAVMNVQHFPYFFNLSKENFLKKNNLANIFLKFGSLFSQLKTQTL